MPGITGMAIGSGSGGGSVWTSAAAGAAAGLFDRLAQRIGVEYDQRKQRQQQRALNDIQIGAESRLMDIQNAHQLEMWKNTNYPAQMEMLKKAGLNPGLLYGEGGAGGATMGAGMPSAGGSQAQSPNTHAQGMGIMQGALAAAQMEQIKAQTQNINADTKNKLAENPNIGLTGANIQADTGNKQANQALTEVNTKIAKLDSEFKEGTLEQNIANVYTEAGKIMAEARQAITNANITGATQETAISQVSANLASTLAGIQLQHAQTDLTKSHIHLNEEQIANWKAQLKQQFTLAQDTLGQFDTQKVRELIDSSLQTLNIPGNIATDLGEKILQALSLGGILKGSSRTTIEGFKKKY